MHMLYSLHEIPAVRSGAVQLVEVDEQARLQQLLSLVPAQAVGIGVIVHERHHAEGLVWVLLRWEQRLPALAGFGDDVLQAEQELGRVDVGAFSTVGSLQGIAKLKRGRPPSEAKLRLVQTNIIVEQGQAQPDVSEQRQQYLFRCTRCKAEHRRVLLPNSVDSPMVLVCKICNDREELMRLATEFSHNRGVLRVSKEELALVRHVNTYTIDGHHRKFLYQVSPWLGVNSFLAGVSVDILVLEGPASADPAAMRRGLCVFFDGQGHLRTRPRNQSQADTDRAASTQAASAGYCVLRIYKSDTDLKMTILDQAWRARSDRGWVRVSPSWNDGAHPERLLPP